MHHALGFKHYQRKRLLDSFAALWTEVDDQQPSKFPSCKKQASDQRDMKNHRKKNQLGVSKNRGTPKWMVYNGKLY